MTNNKTNTMKKILSIILILAAFTTVKAQETCLLEQAPVQNLVQDYANILSDGQEQSLRQALLAFNDSVSTQILVVTVTNLCDYDKAEFTYTLGQKWGVGQDNKDNGVVIMVKPKTETEKGAVFIAPGYGLEGVLPDAIAKRIVENEMIPSFKKQDYYSGIANAVTTVMSITGGEFTADEYAKSSGIKNMIPFALFFIIFIVVMIGKGAQTRRYAATNNMGFLAAWTLMNASSRNHGGSFGSFGSGGGSFGGFGGGGFGGGGAGGSW